MAAANKAPSTTFLAELDTFTSNLGPLDYSKLLPAAYEAGYRYRLAQKSVERIEHGALVTFDVLIGKTDVPLEFYDTISIAVENQSPVSLAARVRAIPTLIYLFFGRLPPAPEAQTTAPPAERTVEMRDADVVLEPQEEGGEYVPAAPPLAAPRVVDHMEPDGVPIFADLYALGNPSADVIAAVLDKVDDFLQRAQSVETINAMGVKNPMMIKFIKDLGTPEDSAELMDMITKRRNLVAPPVLSNARRRSAPAVN